MSIVVRERDREREWDSDAYRDDRPRNVTVRRYKVPDRNEDDRIDTVSRHSRYDDGPRYPSNYRDTDVREYRFETDNSRGRPEAQRDLDEYRSEPGRAPEYREVRVSRAVSREPPRQEPYPYELDHYTKTTDYYARQEDPRPIVIRQDAPQPIIIREQAPQPLVIRERDSRPTSPRSVLLERQRESEREEKQSHVSKRTEIDKRSAAVDRRTEPDRRTEVDRRTEINEERTVARREEPPPPVRQEPEDEYYYQRTTRQIARDERDDYDDYRSRKEDARHRRDDDRYSDEEYRYKRIERDYGDSRHMSRSKSRHRLDVAEGAVAGLAGAALMNRKKKGKGEESGGLKNLVGGAALGAVGGEVVSRARSRFGRDHSGSRSRSRSRSYEREGRGRRHRRDHSRTPSRSGSRDRLNNIGKLAGVAVVGALAGYAASRRRGNKDEERRSRSRVRHSSRSRSTSRDSRVDEYTEDGKNSKRRNSTMAKAGLASAAAAGVVDRIRSRSRGGRSKSRVRQGLPIAAAGVGGAALAGLYENKKAKKEKVKAEREVSATRSQSRSRGHAMSPEGETRGPPAIEYGNDPITAGESHARPRSRADSYYSDHGQGGRRSPGSSSSESPRHRRYVSRSRSRGPDYAEGAAGTGVVGAAAHDASKRRERKRAEKERRRQEQAVQEMQPQDGYAFGPYGQEQPLTSLPPAQPEYPEHYFPNSNVYPPPNAYSPVPNFVGQPVPNQQAYGANGYAPPGSVPPQEPYGHQPGVHPGPYQGNNVSITSHDLNQVKEDVITRPPSPVSHSHDPQNLRKAVQFNLSPEMLASPHQASPELSPRSLPWSEDSDVARVDGQSDHRERHGCNDTVRRHGHFPRQSTSSNRRRRQRSYSESDGTAARQRNGRRQHAESDHDSSDTEILPDRFDNEGKKLPERGEDPLADKLQDILRGRGAAGKFFSRFAGDLLGSGSSSGRGGRA